MTNIWSDNKYIEIAINALLFLLGINFMHLGQFALPLICLLLFIDRKFKFKVNNMKIFVVLCLFALSFFVFSYKLGFYSVMGFTLPMAYYIGSNLKKDNRNNLKYVIYIFALGMSSYLLINFLFEMKNYPFVTLFSKVRRLDIWTGQLVRPTIMSVNAYLLISVLYYIQRYEKNVFIKVVSLMLFINVVIYNIAMARRTIILMIGLSFILCIVLEIFFTENIKLNRKTVLCFTCAVIFLFVVALIIIFSDLFGLWTKISSTSLYNKIVSYGISSERMNYFIKGVKLAPFHLWGGQEISSIIGIQIHDLWTDIYDYAGIIPWLMILIYSVYCIKVMIKSIRSDKYTKSFKMMLINLFVVIILSFMMEPSFTSTSIYVIVIVVLFSGLERILF